MSYSSIGALFFLLSICVVVTSFWLLIKQRIKAKELLQKTLDQEEAHIASFKEKALSLVQREKNAFELESHKKEFELHTLEKEYLKKVDQLKIKQEFISREEAQINSRKKKIKILENNLLRTQKSYRQRLQQVNHLTKKQAKELLFEQLRLEMDKEIADLRRSLLYETEKQTKEESQRILIDAMHRMTSQGFADITATTVALPNDEIKGRIIGREGRNIRTFESISGTTLMIDESPDFVLVSCFNPVRREIAKIALQELVKDGRIHPANIEEKIEDARKNVDAHILELGQKTATGLELKDMHPEILNFIGGLHFHLSNNQNSLDHSIEVATLCGLIALEMKCDPQIAKRCGLFHDLGKTLDQNHSGSHAIAASNILKTFGEDERVVNAVASSHDEVEKTSPYAGILSVADALSSTRPGSRGSTVEGYIERINSLEAIAKKYQGVKEVYAMRAGREIRVLVSPDMVTDNETRELCRNLKKQIENELSYPSSIKVIAIRETRFTETAS